LNIIFAKHDCCDKEFCFEVPDSMAKYIVKGDILLVDTLKGITLATATSSVVAGNGAEDVALKSGAYLPLKRVISFADQKMQTYIKNQTIASAINLLNKEMTNCDLELPF
jgi:hypothetical protein